MGENGYFNGSFLYIGDFNTKCIIGETGASWQGDVLPLNYTRMSIFSGEKHFNTGAETSQPDLANLSRQS